MSQEDDGDPNVGMTVSEFARLFADIHVRLGLELPDSLL